MQNSYEKVLESSNFEQDLLQLPFRIIVCVSIRVFDGVAVLHLFLIFHCRMLVVRLSS